MQVDVDKVYYSCTTISRGKQWLKDYELQESQKQICPAGKGSDVFNENLVEYSSIVPQSSVMCFKGGILKIIKI